jgi:sodium-dependent dicarboxylate transporter 2/3/5
VDPAQREPLRPPPDLSSEGLSEAELRFDRRRRRLGLLLAPVVFMGLLVMPTGLGASPHRLAAVLGLVMVLWVTEALPLPVTALLGPALATVLGVAPARQAFAPFAEPVIFLFLGSFLLAEALQVHGLDRRLALGILALPGASSSAARVRLFAGLATALLSMWISNTAAAAMMLPVALGLVRALGAAGAAEAPRALLLVVGIAASLGGIATPVGTPPNLIALGFLERIAGRPIDFLTFMAVGVPLSLALMTMAVLVVGRRIPRAAARGDIGDYVRGERRALPRWNGGERACAAAFGTAVALWLLPGVIAVLGLPPTTALGRLAERLDESVVSLLAAALLFVWPVGGRRALSWADAARIDWGTLLLFGGGLSLGKLMFDTDLAGVLGRGLVQATGVETLWGLTALALAVAILLTEFTSNTASVNMLAPLVLALARDLSLSPVPPLLAVCFGASMGFMLPIGTPPNAIVYGTGLVPLAFMIRTGILVDVLAFFVILAGLRLLCPLLGLA